MLSGTAMSLDYYDILGVPPKAGAGEIKKAYRLLALRWHPDRNAGNPWATNRFLRLGEAYRVLMDPVRRAAYDGLRAREKKPGKVHRQSHGQHRRSAGPTPEKSASRRPPRWFSSGDHPTRGLSRSPGRERPRPSTTPQHKARQSSSGERFSWLLFFKGLPQRLVQWLTGSPLAGLEWEMFPALDRPDVIMDLRLPRRLAARGAKVNFLISSDHQRRRLRLSIPPGVTDGAWLRIKGGGKTTGGQRGHLFINIRIRD